MVDVPVMRAKMASMGRSGYARQVVDWYVEPRWSVEALRSAVDFEGSIYDPCAGMGTIPYVFEEAGHMVMASDLRGYDGAPGLDFLTQSGLLGFTPDNVVVNPPFKSARGIIEQARSMAGQKVAALCRLAFLETSGRARWFEESGLSSVVVMENRVSCPPGEIATAELIEDPAWMAKGGSMAYGWFIWERGHQGAPLLKFAGRDGPKKGAG